MNFLGQKKICKCGGKISAMAYDTVQLGEVYAEITRYGCGQCDTAFNDCREYSRVPLTFGQRVRRWLWA